MQAAAARVPTDADAFAGSYDPADVTFLLKRVEIAPTAVADKEAAIQSGRRHYSEMVGHEAPPSPAYEALFESALAANGARMGREVAALALALDAALPAQATLASLVRAGVPLGVLLARALRQIRGASADVAHFGVSIIRDRGLDEVAMDRVVSGRDPSGVVFVDGWTGKGAISGELERSLAGRPSLAPRLVVLADPCGRAWLAASGDDWLIPSGILGATVSGLVSRTVLNADVVGPGDFHACVAYGHLRPHDRSRAFVDAIWPTCSERSRRRGPRPGRTRTGNARAPPRAVSSPASRGGWASPTRTG